MTVSFELGGMTFLALNGGPNYTFSEAISFQVSCGNQEEVDHFWSKLSGGGEEGPCGWLKDKFGVSWQVTPIEMLSLLQDPDPGRAQRAFAVYRQEGIEPRIGPIDAGQQSFDQLDAGQPPLGERLRKLGERRGNHRRRDRDPRHCRRGDPAPRQRRRSTRALAFRAVSGPASSLDDLGHQIQTVLHRRCALLVERMAIGFGDPVLAQRQNDVLRMRHGNDTGGVDSAHAADQFENALELGVHVGGFRRRDLDPGQMCDALHFIEGKGHVRGSRQISGAETKLNRVS
jgi:hypothetical protein